MDDGAVSLGRGYRLTPRGGAGLSCGEDGLVLGQVPLGSQTAGGNGPPTDSTVLSGIAFHARKSGSGNTKGLGLGRRGIGFRELSAKTANMNFAEPSQSEELKSAKRTQFPAEFHRSCRRPKPF
ncbi:MAG: hypothetical protein ACREEL_04675 [Stellaceae bacterium]